MTLRLSRDRTKPPRRLSEAQRAANERSFRIFRLRGLWTHAAMLTGNRRTAMEALIDAELVALGAEPQTPRFDRQMAELDERWAQEDAARAGLFADLPF